ncbi:hypothetical protein CEXT_38601 [Caerostris extrusa]|uniref:Uncharacterized protein n=1 Tax=Caerostris extrusa TaxID=172846 RepID=A0AAV4VRU9_CAEEX|nr:hypothetical protein CEXT_38601 [Caerostris extrusa]
MDNDNSYLLQFMPSDAETSKELLCKVKLFLLLGDVYSFHFGICGRSEGRRSRYKIPWKSFLPVEMLIAASLLFHTREFDSGYLHHKISLCTTHHERNFGDQRHSKNIFNLENVQKSTVAKFLSCLVL